MINNDNIKPSEIQHTEYFLRRLMERERQQRSICAKLHTAAVVRFPSCLPRQIDLSKCSDIIQINRIISLQDF